MAKSNDDTPRRRSILPGTDAVTDYERIALDRRRPRTIAPTCTSCSAAIACPSRPLCITCNNEEHRARLRESAREIGRELAAHLAQLRKVSR